jgi:geranylgeranyl pyrophosphate synthase
VNFQTYFANRQVRINKFLQYYLPSPETEPQTLHNAMHYAVLNGGKRIRPLLVYATGESLGAKLTALDRAACAVELIHAYSLVHDDLPAMDNDDLRRGVPSCHKAFDEATAILVGDALQTLAFQSLTDVESDLPLNTVVSLITSLAKAAGSKGMAGGQSLDLIAAGKPMHLKDVEKIHHLKTGALIGASIEMGALTAQADEKILTKLKLFSYHLGLCFQIQDDILDMTANEADLIRIAAQKKLAHYYQLALSSLDELPMADKLKDLSNYIVNRDH